MRWLAERLKRWSPASRGGAWLPANDLLRDAAYRRLWTSIVISSFGGQVTMLALPLTAAVLEMMTALRAAGHDKDDHSGLVQHYEAIANTRIGGTGA